MKSKTINKEEVIKEYKTHEGDTGSTEVQIALLTTRINHLIEHLKKHDKDKHTQRGLLMMVGHRKKLLSYLYNNDIESYRNLTKKLDLKEKV